MARHKYAASPGGAEPTPFLAMWEQMRTALAELLIPFLASLKTIWLLVVTPVAFFRTLQVDQEQTHALRSPVDIFWRTLTGERREPLDPAHFLLFGILTAALAGFEFGNSNRLLGVVQRTGVARAILDNLGRANPALDGLITDVRAFLESPFALFVRSLLDLNLIAALFELLITLFLIMIFAYLFRILVGRGISAGLSYSFWLYVTGLQFLTTAVSAILVRLSSLPALRPDALTPELFFWLLESVLFVLWQLVLPTLILPAVAPTLSRRRVFLSAAAIHAGFAVANWLLTAGFFAALALWQQLAS
ncbi:MAG: hypothetical protein KC425_15685 [Anaerolineales bacterium]|nr:hypothetical protein [Anaerolineales bacterium]